MDNIKHLNEDFHNIEEDYEVNNLGGGGFLEVNSYSLGDGDTTYFRFNSSSIAYLKFNFIL